MSGLIIKQVIIMQTIFGGLMFVHKCTQQVNKLRKKLPIVKGGLTTIITVETETNRLVKKSVY